MAKSIAKQPRAPKDPVGKSSGKSKVAGLGGAAKAPAKKPKAAKDPEAPKRNKNSFMFWADEVRPFAERARSRAPFDQHAATPPASNASNDPHAPNAPNDHAEPCPHVALASPSRRAPQERKRAEYTGVAMAEVGRLLGAKWRYLDDEAKAPWAEAAKEDKSRYEARAHTTKLAC